MPLKTKNPRVLNGLKLKLTSDRLKVTPSSCAIHAFACICNTTHATLCIRSRESSYSTLYQPQVPDHPGWMLVAYMLCDPAVFHRRARSNHALDLKSLALDASLHVIVAHCFKDLVGRVLRWKDKSASRFLALRTRHAPL